MAKKGVQLCKEKAGKANATEEDEKFNSKIASLQATLKAFQNLQKVGKSIFTTENAKNKGKPDFEAVSNPADEFVQKIREVKRLEKAYRSQRLAMDTAKESHRLAAAAAENPAAKNADKKASTAETLRQAKEEAISEYKVSKDSLLQGIDELESVRDEKFTSSIDTMCTLLKELKPDWEGVTQAPSSSAPANDEEKVAENPDTSGGNAPPPQKKEATDSESD